MPRVNKSHPVSNRYSDEEQKMAVAILAQYGGGTTNEGIAAAQARFPTVGRSTLARWWDRWADEVGPKALEIVIEDPQSMQVMGNTDEMMFKLINKILEHALDQKTINGASMKDSAITFGIMYDKIMQRAGISPEMLSKCKRFIGVMHRKGYDPVAHLDDLIEEYEQLPDAVK